MSREKRLQRLQSLAETQRDQAAQTLSARMKQQVAAQKQLEKLQTYTAEYRSQSETADTLTSTGKFINNRQFIEKLSTAITQQENRIKLIQHEMVPYVDQWAKAKNRCDAITKAIEKHQQHQQELDEHSQQLDLDTYAARAMLRTQD